LAEQERLRAAKAEHRAEQESELRKQKAAQLEKEKQRTEKEKQKAEQEKQRFFETVRRMLTNGLDITAVMKYTGLSADETAALSDGEKKVKGLPTK
ncbi:MAG: hypothetical protein GY795_08120, partial [Desulfobacterales bacterium]|nr:hypothetical protein [Desulfobacterales bacterium]